MIGQQFDLRIAQLFVFYLIFSLISGALSSERQGKGVSFARAVAIVFLMNELELVFEHQAFILTTFCTTPAVLGGTPL